MARTQANFPVALANSAFSNIYGIQVCKMVEVQIKGRKVDMHEPINRNMDAKHRALTFYTTKSKLDLLKCVLSPSDRISHLAETCNLGTLHDNNMDVFTEDYNGQLMVPANFRVVAFHNEAGQTPLLLPIPRLSRGQRIWMPPRLPRTVERRISNLSLLKQILISL